MRLRLLFPLIVISILIAASSITHKFPVKAQQSTASQSLSLST
jgi:hypothetical protein